jgi:hypothetical protein
MKQPTHVDYKKNLPSTHPGYIRRMLASSTGWIKKGSDVSKQSKAQLSDEKPYRILVVQPEEKRPLGKLAADGKIILKSAVKVSWSELI